MRRVPVLADTGQENIKENQQAIDRNGYNCAGKLEPLKNNLSGYWSVRIDEQNRIVFKISGEQLEILQ